MTPSLSQKKVRHLQCNFLGVLCNHICGGVGILSVILQSPIDVQTVEFDMSILCSSDDTIYAGRIKLQTWVSKLFNGCGNKTLTKINKK